MTRSVHTTRRAVEDASRESYADSATGQQRLTRLQAELDLKRSIKTSVLEERRARQGRTPPAPTSTEFVPIELIEDSEFLLHPASEEDLRAVMRHLPTGTLDGLGAIELALGRYGGDAYYLPDPFTGRPGEEFVPGAWRGAINGYYSPEDATIRLFGIVIGPECQLRTVLESYLRLQTLSTFVHELAHHEDHARRVARGRWRADGDDRVERFAQQRQRTWGRDVVVPYLSERYSDEVELLLRWIEEHGGARVPLETVLGDPRERLGGSHTLRAWWGFPHALEELMTSVVRGTERIEARLEFARALQLGDYHDEIFEVVDNVLVERPGDHRALLLRAEAFFFQGKLDETEEIARTVLAADERNGEAWALLSRIHSRRFEWQEVDTTATRAFELLRDSDASRAADVLGDRARARLALGDLVGLEADLRELETAPFNSLAAQVLWAVLLLEVGRFEEALTQANRLLVRPYRRERNPELVAVRFDAARRLGRDWDEGKLTPETLDGMRARGYGDWADRLASDGLREE